MAVHDGHRARRKKQFREHGLDAFAPHEALELLLFYAIPRTDTNPVAHRLIERFGSLAGVLSATPEQLAEVEGVGENAATLLSLVTAVCRRARIDAAQGAAILSDTEHVGAFFCCLFQGVHEERLYEACLDAKGKLLQCFKVADGSVDTVNINMRRIVENALKCGASAVVLSHNHPSGVALPSPDDNAATLMVYNALRTVGVALTDHIIVADDDFVSLRDNGLFPR